MPDLEKAGTLLSEGVFSRIYRLARERDWTVRKYSKIEGLLDFCVDDDERSLVLDIIDRLRYISGAEYEDALSLIADHIVGEWNLAAEETCVVSKSLDDGPDSSPSVLQSLRHRFAAHAGDGWAAKNFSMNVRDMLASGDYLNFVVVDDFVGTGNQLEKFCGWFAAQIAGAKDRRRIGLFACFFAGMEQARDRKYSEVLKGITAGEWLKRGINDRYDGEELTQASALMQKLEARIKVPDKYSFGYERSESIYYCETLGSPNNNFPVLWWANGSLASPIFERL